MRTLDHARLIAWIAFAAAQIRAFVIANVDFAALLSTLAVESFAPALTAGVRAWMSALKDAIASCLTLVSFYEFLCRQPTIDFCGVAAREHLFNSLFAR